MLFLTAAWLLLRAEVPPEEDTGADAPTIEPLKPPPDVVIEVDGAWVTFVAGETCDGVYVVVPKTPDAVADATFYSIPFHGHGVIEENAFSKSCDYTVILDGAVATKQALEERFQVAIAAEPVSNFLYKAHEGYALGTAILHAGESLTKRGTPLTEIETRAADAFTKIGRHQRLLLGGAVKAKEDPTEAAFLRKVDFSYTVKRFELKENGPLPERPTEPVLEVTELSYDEIEGTIVATLTGEDDVQKCVDRIARQAGTAQVDVRVRIGSNGRVRKIRTVGSDEGKKCFARAAKGLRVDGWEHDPVLLKVTVPANSP